MPEDDRTLEMYVPLDGPNASPTAAPPPGTAGSSSASATATADAPITNDTAAAAAPPRAGGPVLPITPPPTAPHAASYDTPATSTGSIPAGLGRQRPSPVLDPLSRLRVSRLAKWGLLLAVVLFFLWLPLQLAAGRTDGFYLSLVTSSTVFAAIIATGLPRLLLPGLFGRWREAVDALRDWLLVGVATGFLYWGFIKVATIIPFGPSSVDSSADWLKYRLPLLLGASILAVFAARMIAIRRESLVGSGGQAVGQIAIQAILIALLERPIEKGLLAISLNHPVFLAVLLGVFALLLAAGSVGTIFWAATADENIQSIKKRRSTGVVDNASPVELTLTVVGGRESGKTVLLAGAFYEWSTQSLGNLRITPASENDNPAAEHGAVVNLEDVARELYINYQFPVGTVSSQNLPFDLSLGQERVARFTFLDYPGGAIAGRVADSRVVQEFWDRVDDTDGLILIADMSYVRRNRKDTDWLEVRNAYRTVMQRLVDRNGKRRVVPVALVLTKCDEFVDPNTGLIDMAQLEAGLREFQYDELETEWRQMNAERGPGFAEFTTWITSAITYSQPQKGPDGRPDYRKPFMIAPPPPSITPTGCASPLLWISSKVMRWNVTLFADLGSFLYGSSPAVRRRVDSVLEMERVAEERAAKA